MSIYWVRNESNSALDAMVAVEQALAAGNTGTAPQQVTPPLAESDTYLNDNIVLAHAIWPVDPHRIIHSNRPVLAIVINLFQKIVRRLTWWYVLPQWLQISEFHGALVRAIDALIERQRLLAIRVSAIESAHTPVHVYALEQQIQALRAEQRELRRQIAELERRIAEHR